ncbi:NYN domain-containing protein [Colwellia sp. C1TZA3]|uniref:NYN domain-containing protein n=1 Tax=Colwellia sp. C1TZA3 TaxID=2508879 RepID=UPI0011B9D4B7|nr:NYN domain-containing protein [Colwellia sp. C1TZA3]TWX71398.1 NYN domain-containing protein [Colwellia sp. C1TZA3]
MKNSTKSPKIAIFVDVQNIYYTTRDTFQQQFNYRAFWQEISQQGDIVLANAYAIQRSDDQQHKFQKALKHIGFEVKLKPFIQRRDGSAKGDWDVGIAIDVMEVASEVDVVILLSGDGDFDLLLKKVMLRDGVKTRVYGVMALTAQSLINAASEFCPIDRKLLL